LRETGILKEMKENSDLFRDIEREKWIFREIRGNYRDI